jgi:hypothetical protein
MKQLRGLMRSALVMIALGVMLCANPARVLSDQEQPGPDAAMFFFAPSTTEDTQLSHIQGIITSYRVGDRYGEIDIVDGNRRPWKFLMGGDLLVEGHTLNCQEAPQPGLDINLVTCPDWPADITLYRTTVTLTYWQSELNDKPILVVSAIKVTSGPFIP